MLQNDVIFFLSIKIIITISIGIIKMPSHYVTKLRRKEGFEKNGNLCRYTKCSEYFAAKCKKKSTNYSQEPVR